MTLPCAAPPGLSPRSPRRPHRQIYCPQFPGTAAPPATGGATVGWLQRRRRGGGQRAWGSLSGRACWRWTARVGILLSPCLSHPSCHRGCSPPRSWGHILRNAAFGAVDMRFGRVLVVICRGTRNYVSFTVGDSADGHLRPLLGDRDPFPVAILIFVWALRAAAAVYTHGRHLYFEAGMEC